MGWHVGLSFGLLLIGQLAVPAHSNSSEDSLLNWLHASGGFVSIAASTSNAIYAIITLLHLCSTFT